MKIFTKTILYSSVIVFIVSILLFAFKITDISTILISLLFFVLGLLSYIVDQVLTKQRNKRLQYLGKIIFMYNSFVNTHYENLKTENLRQRVGYYANHPKDQDFLDFNFQYSKSMNRNDIQNYLLEYFESFYFRKKTLNKNLKLIKEDPKHLSSFIELKLEKMKVTDEEKRIYDYKPYPPK